MTEQTQVPAAPRVLAAGDGRIVASIGSVSNRFMIDGGQAGGRFALVQHLFEPSALAARAAQYGCDLDFDATFPIVERHGLAF